MGMCSRGMILSVQVHQYCTAQIPPEELAYTHHNIQYINICPWRVASWSEATCLRDPVQCRKDTHVLTMFTRRRARRRSTIVLPSGTHLPSHRATKR